MTDTIKSATAWLTMRVAKLERSFFSYLYERRTRKLETALMAAKMRSRVEMMIKKTPGPPDELETVVISVKLDVEFSSAHELISVEVFTSAIVLHCWN